MFRKRMPRNKDRRKFSSAASRVDSHAVRKLSRGGRRD